MFELNEEMLMAFADGELDPQVMAQVRAALADDPAARERVRLYRRTTQLLRQAYDAPMHEPVPKPLLDAVNPRTNATGSGEVVELATPKTPARGWSVRRMALPLAASLALVIGTAVGYRLQPAPVDTFAGGDGFTGRIALESPLHRLLETKISGEPLEWAADEGSRVRALAQLTFKSADGQYCRQYRVSVAGPSRAGATAGIACRSSESGWRNEIVVNVPADAGAPPGDSYVAAGGRGVEALDRFIEPIMADPALGADEETRAIDLGWR